jgi:N6-adenosine-specific RNA methylase IME4
MSVTDIAALPVRDLAEADRWHINGNRGGSHLYLWTITEHLPNAYAVAEAWGFTVGAVLVWCKPVGRTRLGGIFPSNVEFCLFGRRGSPPAATEKALSRWYQWTLGKHSAKPEAFLDLVEQVSPGPYLELFARRQRLGWDTWGNEALEHVSLGGAA